MTAGETKFKIVYHLYRYGPKSLSELAKSLHMPRQKVHYNLTQLIEEGVVLKAEDGKFTLQPLFTEEATDLYLKLINLMLDIADYLIIDEDVDINKALVRNFEYYVLINLPEVISLLSEKTL